MEKEKMVEKYPCFYCKKEHKDGHERSKHQKECINKRGIL